MRCQLHYRRPPQVWRGTGFLERQLHHVDAFIAMSEFSRAKHREFGFPRDMEVLPYFLPDPEPGGAKVEGASPHPRPYFLFVGRLEKIKGLDDVIPVFGEYSGADLVIAGDGDYAATLRERAQGLARVHFLGRVGLDELRQYYEHAVALIVPSVCFETFGIILIEAFKQGTPVIARRIGPFPEIVTNSGGGELLCNTGGADRCDEAPAGESGTPGPAGSGRIPGILAALVRERSGPRLSGHRGAGREKQGRFAGAPEVGRQAVRHQPSAVSGDWCDDVCTPTAEG